MLVNQAFSNPENKINPEEDCVNYFNPFEVSLQLLKQQQMLLDQYVTKFENVQQEVTQASLRYFSIVEAFPTTVKGELAAYPNLVQVSPSETVGKKWQLMWLGDTAELMFSQFVTVGTIQVVVARSAVSMMCVDVAGKPATLSVVEADEVDCSLPALKIA
jgi:hypothetical protein